MRLGPMNPYPTLVGYVFIAWALKIGLAYKHITPMLFIDIHRDRGDMRALRGWPHWY